MNIFQSIVLGIIQGLTEFLPVSSSGHLVVSQKLLGISPNLSFIVLVHLGTLLAVLLYFFKDILKISFGFLSGVKRIIFERERPRAIFYSNTDFKLSCYLLFGSLFTAAIAFAFKDIFESLFSSGLAVGVFWIITGVLILFAEIVGSGKRMPVQMNFIDSVIIGIFQGLAVAPGLSRAGTTISASLALGLERKFAARFSFLLAIPAILGAGVIKLKDLLDLGISGIGTLEILCGFVASVVSGYFAIKIFMNLIARKSIKIFAYYCFVLGAVVIIISLL